MAIAKFGRVITAMITPFKENGDVNYEGASSLSKYLVNHGSEEFLSVEQPVKVRPCPVKKN